MVAGPARRLWHNPTKTEIAEIKFIDKDINHTHRVVVVDPLFKALGEQGALAAVKTFDKSLHAKPNPIQ
jgi:hypothetical protein